MKDIPQSHSVQRFSLPAWIGWFFTLILSVILILSNLSQDGHNLNWLNRTATGIIILFSLVIIFVYIIYRRKQKKTGEVVTVSDTINVPHSDFEKLVTQLIDLRVAFQAITLIATVAITFLSISGYSTIKDAIKESRLAVIRDSLDSLNLIQANLNFKHDSLKTQMMVIEIQLKNYHDSLDIHETNYNRTKKILNDSVLSAEKKLTNFKNQLNKNLKNHINEVKSEVAKGLNSSIENILDKKFRETSIEFPEVKNNRSIPISVKSPISAHISIVSSDSSRKEQECRITFTDPKSLITPISFKTIAQKIVIKRTR